jgi:deoxyribodipyrimidine photo-lyase
MDKVAIFWFRRDLRLDDNVGFYKALSENEEVYPFFIFDPNILSELPRNDARVGFIHATLNLLNEKLRPLGSSIRVMHATPMEAIKTLVNELHIEAVYTNHDYEPYAIQRDKEISEFLAFHSISFRTFKDQVIFEKSDVTKDDGTPYTVFTPYSKKWKSILRDSDLISFPSEDYLPKLSKTMNNIPTLSELGFIPSTLTILESNTSESLLLNYHHTRDFPSIEGTSRLSFYLRFGTLSIRKVTTQALRTNEKFLNELIWREFYQYILWHFPHVVGHSFKSQYDAIEWRNNKAEFEAWCKGETGYPIVDAGMRELNETGWMHNRVRMITASFLTKHLLIDWRWGEAYFAEKLLDFELASNNGGWQWAAGSGVDAAPYFRIFNPKLQTEKFDPKLIYIRKWVPELDSFSYAKPIVDHAYARERCLKVYKKALTPI